MTLLSGTIAIESERLLLRRIELADLGYYAAIHADPKLPAISATACRDPKARPRAGCARFLTATPRQRLASWRSFAKAMAR